MPEKSQPVVWALLATAVVAGLLLTALVEALPGDAGLSAAGWLGTVATLAALWMAVGIYRLQESSTGRSHQQLLEELEAQAELIAGLAPAPAPPAATVPPAPPGPSPLTDEQVGEIEAQYGSGVIAGAWDPGSGKKGNRARLVLLNDGSLLTVYTGGRVGGTYIREIAPNQVAAK